MGEKGDGFVAETKEKKLLDILTFEVLWAERKNLRSRVLTDQKMSDKIQKIIIDELKTK